jgi:hypothetical protein
MDAFVGRMSLDISDNSADTLTYYGGTGDDTVTGFAVSNGTAWLVGSAGANLDGEGTVGTKDGYVAQVNVGTGAVDWSQRLTGKDGYATPTSVAVSGAGASAWTPSACQTARWTSPSRTASSRRPRPGPATPSRSAPANAAR